MTTCAFRFEKDKIKSVQKYAPFLTSAMINHPKIQISSVYNRTVRVEYLKVPRSTSKSLEVPPVTLHYFPFSEGFNKMCILFRGGGLKALELFPKV